MLFRAQEVLSQEDALLAGVLAAGAFNGTEHADFVRLVGAQRFLFAEAVAELPAADRARYEALGESAGLRPVPHAGGTFIEQGGSGESADRQRPSNGAAATDAGLRGLLDLRLWGPTTSSPGPAGRHRGSSSGSSLAGVLGLIAVIASIVISITTARALVRQLERLRNAALELAAYRLPRVVERLQHGEKVDVAAEAPPLDFGRDEIGQVGQAFNAVQETAVRVAVEQAELRRSVRDVFLSLARRSQALLHRQLGLLDAMERRATDAEELAELFRIDHLATRMRRNAENLIVLSGATAGRAWRQPVPMVDVLRGALAEVEDYTRVTVLPVGLGLAARPGRRRRHPPARRADRERGLVLAAADRGAGRRLGGRQRLRHRDRGPRPRHERGGARGRQRAAAQPAGVQAHQHRPAGPVRGRQARRAARHPGPADRVPVRRHHRDRAAARDADRRRAGDDVLRSTPATRAGTDAAGRHARRPGAADDSAALAGRARTTVQRPPEADCRSATMRRSRRRGLRSGDPRPATVVDRSGRRAPTPPGRRTPVPPGAAGRRVRAARSPPPADADRPSAGRSTAARRTAGTGRPTAPVGRRPRRPPSRRPGLPWRQRPARAAAPSGAAPPATAPRPAPGVRPGTAGPSAGRTAADRAAARRRADPRRRETSWRPTGPARCAGRTDAARLGRDDRPHS